MQPITDYTRHDHRSINRSLLQGIVTEQATDLANMVATLPMAPGTTYRTFWLDDLDSFTATLRSGDVIFRAFTSTSRLRAVADRFNGNVRLTINGYTGRDIAPFSDAPGEAETLFLPGRTFRVDRVRTRKIGGQIGVVEAELTER